MMHFAISTDANYLAHTATMLNSVVQSTTEPCTIHILTRDVPAASFPTTFAGGRVQVDVIDASSHLRDMKGLRFLWLTMSAWDRLFLPSVLPDVDKLLYLDVDLVVRRDPRPLFDMDCGETGICAKASIANGYQTVSSWIRSSAPSDARMLQLADQIPDVKNFNSGVMLMDLRTLRRRGFVEHVTEVVRKWSVNDQMAAAIYANNKFATLPATWNVFVGVDSHKVKPWSILHWAGGSKPWARPFQHRAEWEKYTPPTPLS